MKKCLILLLIPVLFGVSCEEDSPSGNQPPVISTIPDKLTFMNKSVAPFEITVTDPDTDISQVTLTASSQNKDLLPDENIEIQGNGTNRMTIITPGTDQTGSTVIDVFATDGQAQSQQSFALTVNLPQSQWKIQDSGISSNLNAIHFQEDTIGWAVGTMGTILKSNDNGVSWQNLSISSPIQDLVDVAFRGAYYGWIVGPFTDGDISGGKVIFSDDGGATWTEQKIFEESLSAIAVTEISFIWVVGDNGLVAWSADGGESWIQKNMAGNEDLNGVFFLEDNLGWVTGENASVYVTQDAGGNWYKLLGEQNFDLNAIYFIDQFTGWACGNFNTIVKTDNGGITWSDYKPSIGYPEDDWKDIFFVDEDTGWLIGQNGKIYRSTDGGSSWNFDGNSAIVEDLNDMVMIDGYTGFIAGQEGTILKYQP